MTEPAADEMFDLVIVGGGTAALVASLGAAGIGARVALVEAERVGGDCLWTGCVPSKALISAAEVAHQMRTAHRHGLAAVTPEVDLAAVMASVRAAQAIIEPHDSPERLEREGVVVVQGWGVFDGPGRVVVGDQVLRYRSALIATGSRPVVPAIDGLSEAQPLTSDDIWGLPDLPPRFVVLGGGPIGCELGQAFARLGSQVTIVEAMDTLVPRELADVGQLLARQLQSEGLDVRTGVRATAVLAATKPESGWALQLDDGSQVGFDKILVSVGRRPSTANIGLETVGVDTDQRGHVMVDDLLRTTGDNIFAAGDVTGQMPFTHVAAYHARLVVTNALLKARRKADHTAIPWVTFTDPEIARVGIDADAARAMWGDDAVIERFAYSGLDRAITHADTAGYAELVGDKKRRLVGATIIGHAAGESIAEMTAWMSTGRKIDDISTTVHAYPTFTEGPSRAADDVLRARFFTPGVRRMVRPLLSLLRRFDAPRAS